MRNLTLWFDEVFDKDDVIILSQNQSGLNNDNNHIRREIVELDQILVDLSIYICLHSCQHVNEWGAVKLLSEWITLSSLAQFLAPKQAQTVSAVLCLFTSFHLMFVSKHKCNMKLFRVEPLNQSVCQNYCLKGWRGNGWTYSETYTSVWERTALDVLIHRNMFSYSEHQFSSICSCMCLSAEFRIISEWRETRACCWFVWFHVIMLDLSFKPD